MGRDSAVRREDRQFCFLNAIDFMGPIKKNLQIKERGTDSCPKIA